MKHAVESVKSPADPLIIKLLTGEMCDGDDGEKCFAVYFLEEKMLPEKIEITEEVFHVINEELEYQSTLQALGRADDTDHGVAGQIVTLVEYTNETVSRWAHNKGEEEALDSLRKIAAIAVRALVLYGCPRRKNDRS